MDHFNQVCADGNRLMSIEEDSTGLSLSRVCHDSADGISIGEYRAVWGGSRPDEWRGGSVA